MQFFFIIKSCTYKLGQDDWLSFQSASLLIKFEVKLHQLKECPGRWRPRVRWVLTFGPFGRCPDVNCPSHNSDTSHLGSSPHLSHLHLLHSFLSSRARGRSKLISESVSARFLLELKKRLFFFSDPNFMLINSTRAKNQEQGLEPRSAPGTWDWIWKKHQKTSITNNESMILVLKDLRAKRRVLKDPATTRSWYCRTPDMKDHVTKKRWSNPGGGSNCFWFMAHIQPD